MAKTVSGTTTNYLYDRDNIVQELSSGSVVSNWLTGGTDEIFTGSDSTGTANFLTDALGSTVALTNSSGGSIANYAYEPFGNATVTSGSSTNEFQYAGRENDGTGLFSNRARYYSPVFQRFVSEDPIGWRGGTNAYAYVRNAPTESIDPTGLYPSDLACNLLGAIFNYSQIALIPIGPSPLVGLALRAAGASIALSCVNVSN